MPVLDPVLQKAHALQKEWHYVGDSGAIREFCRRLAENGRRGDPPLTYSALAKGVVLHLPNVYGGRALELGVPEWEDIHRAIIGECLAEVSILSYEAGGFLASALAVSKVTGEPSEGFRILLEKLGFVSSRKDKDCDRVWIDQWNKACDWLKTNPNWPDA